MRGTTQPRRQPCKELSCSVIGQSDAACTQSLMWQRHADATALT